MATAPVSSVTATQSNLGLDYVSMLRLILAELTYQDPLKPVDNTEFVGQLAQFSQLQQGQILNQQITSLIAAQATSQGTSLLGRTVDIGGDAPATGQVQAVTFTNGQPFLTIRTSTGAVLANISITTVTQVR